MPAPPLGSEPAIESTERTPLGWDVEREAVKRYAVCALILTSPAPENDGVTALVMLAFLTFAFGIVIGRIMRLYQTINWGAALTLTVLFATCTVVSIAAAKGFGLVSMWPSAFLFGFASSAMILRQQKGTN